MSYIASQPETAAIVAIGSAVRPAYHAESDIDFLAIADDEAAVDGPRPIDVDLRIFRCCEVEKKIQDGDDLLGSAIRFGRAIFERDEFWKDLCSRWVSRLPFPLPQTSIARALRFEHVARELVAMGDFEAASEQIAGMLTQQARATLLSSCIYPASRPELPMQLRMIKQYRLAEILESALRRRLSAEVLEELTHKTSKPLDQNFPALKATARCSASESGALRSQPTPRLND